MENDILWHYRFPHDGWEYDGAVTELHAAMPEGVTDPYTPNGIADPIKPEEGADIGNDHTTSAGWHPSYFKMEMQNERYFRSHFDRYRKSRPER